MEESTKIISKPYCLKIQPRELIQREASEIGQGFQEQPNIIIAYAGGQLKEPGLQLLDLPIFSQSPVPLEQALTTNSAEAIEQDKLNKIKQNEGSSIVYTREQVVDFILDLLGYTSDKPLYLYKILEPSFGSGDFLLRIIERLLISIKSHEKTGFSLACLQHAVRAVELKQEAFEATKEKILSLLEQYEVDDFLARHLVNSWLVKGDFLLVPLKDRFDFVAGNPPYIRQELIASTLIDCYRNLYKTIYDRADIYVPFMEKSLGLLSGTGQLGFICSDRWMKNRYGAPLRRLIAEKFSLRVYVDMYGTKSFKSDVVAYPAITVISKEKSAFTRTAFKPSLNPKNLKKLAQALISPISPARESGVEEVQSSARGADPWLLIPAEQIKLIRRLENEFPLIEEAGCKVGIGVASGADKAFIAKFEDLDVEPDRKLPLVMTDDIASGALQWGGFGIVNPFMLDGSLVELDSYPRLKKFFEERRELISKRHCARKNPVKWYRTLDRIHPELTTKPKLLIPDIKGEPNVVYDSGHFYPHHNLYYVVSEDWDLLALQAVLLSSITRFFVSSYSVRMHGGCLRFQAQYLRKIRLPRWKNVAPKLRAELVDAAQSRNLATCNEATYELYGLTADEIGVLGGMEL